jgi:hypothetical protein
MAPVPLVQQQFNNPNMEGPTHGVIGADRALPQTTSALVRIVS